MNEVVVTSAADLMGADLHVEISDVSGVLTRPCRRVVDLAADARTVVDDLSLQLDPSRMADVAERRPGRLTVRITADGVVLHESH